MHAQMMILVCSRAGDSVAVQRTHGLRVLRMSSARVPARRPWCFSYVIRIRVWQLPMQKHRTEWAVIRLLSTAFLSARRVRASVRRRDELSAVGGVRRLNADGGSAGGYRRSKRADPDHDGNSPETTLSQNESGATSYCTCSAYEAALLAHASQDNIPNKCTAHIKDADRVERVRGTRQASVARCSRRAPHFVGSASLKNVAEKPLQGFSVDRFGATPAFHDAVLNA